MQLPWPRDFTTISLRDELKRQYILGEYNLTVSLSDLSSFNEVLADKLIKSPTTYLPLVRFNSLFRSLRRENVIKPGRMTGNSQSIIILFELLSIIYFGRGIDVYRDSNYFMF